MPATEPPEAEVVGGDPELAARAGPDGPLVWFRPSDASDVARAIGLAVGAEHPGPTALALDAMVVEAAALDHDVTPPPIPAADVAVNAVILGAAPDRQRWGSPTFPIEVVVDGRPAFSGRAVGVVVASGQYVRGLDVVPRGHPGDGRLEVQVYATRRRERGAVRGRLRRGDHLPHPRILERSGRAVEVRLGRGAAPLEVDARPGPDVSRVRLEVVPRAIRVLV